MGLRSLPDGVMHWGEQSGHGGPQGLGHREDGVTAGGDWEPEALPRGERDMHAGPSETRTFPGMWGGPG